MKTIYSVGSRVPGGGVGNVSYQAAKALHEQGWLKKLICFGCQGTNIPQDLVEKLPFDLVHRLKGHTYFYSNFTKDSLYDLAATAFIKDADILHSWNNHCLKSLRKAKRLGMVTIVERNSLYPTDQAQLIKEEYARFGIETEPTSKASLHRAEAELRETDYVFCPSEFVKQSLLKNGIPENKIKLIPQGVESQSFHTTRTRESFEGTFKVVFVGHLGFRKGLPYLLEAWDSLTFEDKQLMLIGSEEEEIKPFLSHYRDREDIIFAGYTDPKTYLKEATVFVCPSIEDGFGLVVLEALAMGVPVIVSQNTGAKDAVNNGETGYQVPTGDKEAIAQALTQLNSDRDLAYRMSQQATLKGQEYDWSVYRRRLVETYRGLLNGSEREEK